MKISKQKEEFMKNVLAALVVVGSVNAFAGYTAEVCQTNEAGLKVSCRMVYFNRNLGEAQYQEPTICSGEAQNTICENPKAHVPAVLSRINQWFLDHGFTARADDGTYTGGN